METENKTSTLEELFAVLATGRRDEIKAAKKQIEKLWYANGRKFAKAGDMALKILDDVDRIPDAEHKAAVISGMQPMFLTLADKYFDRFAQFVLTYMEHPDGRVREAARHTASWLRFKHSEASMILERGTKGKQSDKRKSDAEEDIRTFEYFIDRIEELMKKHAPADKPMYVGELAPSVYKSLVLFWYDMAFNTSRDVEHREELIDPENKQYIPRLGSSEIDEEVDIDEVEESLWDDEKDGSPQEGAVWLKRLEEMAKKRFVDELARLKFSTEEIVDMVAVVRAHGQGIGPHVLEGMLSKGVERGSIVQLFDANNVVREMEAFANHRTTYNTHGMISHLLVEVVVERECVGSGKPDDLAVFVQLMQQSHEAIDVFFAQYEKEEEKSFLSMLEFNKKFSKTAEDERAYAKEYEEKENICKRERYFGRSIAHHVLDWYIQSAPADFNRTREPRKIAAYILKMVRDHNAEATDGEVSLAYGNKELAQFGGWKGAGNLNMVEYKVARPVMDAVGDPDLLLIDPSKIQTAKSGKRGIGFQRGMLDFEMPDSG